MSIIDAHQHFWDPRKVDYPWLDPSSDILYRRYEPDDLAPLMSRFGVSQTVLVQSGDSRSDSEYMFDVTSDRTEVAGIVAWVPLDDPSAATSMLDEWKRHDRFVGIRNLIHTREDPDWILRSDVGESLALLEAERVPFDYVAVLARHLDHLPLLCARYPSLDIVIDHLAKPPIGLEDWSTWEAAISRAADSPQVFAKVSGLYAAGDEPSEWTPDGCRRALDFALNLFGADRLMFGSDWPICEIAGGYDEVVGCLLDLFGELTPTEQTALLGGTATRFYGLSSR